MTAVDFHRIRLFNSFIGRGSIGHIVTPTSLRWKEKYATLPWTESFKE
jgi:hypothetical protein